MAQILLVAHFSELGVLEKRKKRKQLRERNTRSDDSDQSRGHATRLDPVLGRHVHNGRQNNKSKSNSEDNHAVDPVIHQLLVIVSVNLGEGHDVKSECADPPNDVQDGSESGPAVRALRLAVNVADKVGDWSLCSRLWVVAPQFVQCVASKGNGRRIQNLLRHVLLLDWRARGF